MFTSGFYFQVLIAVFFWYLWFILFQKVMTIEGMLSFDPFQVLDVPSDATIQ